VIPIASRTEVFSLLWAGRGKATSTQEQSIDGIFEVLWGMWGLLNEAQIGEGRSGK